MVGSLAYSSLLFCCLYSLASICQRCFRTYKTKCCKIQFFLTTFSWMLHCSYQWSSHGFRVSWRLKWRGCVPVLKTSWWPSSHQQGTMQMRSVLPRSWKGTVRQQGQPNRQSTSGERAECRPPLAAGTGARRKQSSASPPSAPVKHLACYCLLVKWISNVM